MALLYLNVQKIYFFTTLVLIFSLLQGSMWYNDILEGIYAMILILGLFFGGIGHLYFGMPPFIFIFLLYFANLEFR